MTRRTKAVIYEELNALWPDPVPKMTDDEAVRAAKRLYRWAMGQPFVGEVRVASGNRYSYLRRDVSDYHGGILVVNPDRGWNMFVHALSHSFWGRVNPLERPHSKDHARFEMNMVKQVLRRGWLDGRLRAESKPEPTVIDKKIDRLARIDLGIMRWEKKVNRAEVALKKLHSQRRSVVRAIEREAETQVEKTDEKETAASTITQEADCAQAA